jgi:excinuclease ABC subunit A
LFSFNNPFGACPTCHGFGNIIELDMDLVVPDASKSINHGAIEPWSKPHYRSQLAELKRAARKSGASSRRAVVRAQRQTKRTFVIEGVTGRMTAFAAFSAGWSGRNYKVHVRVFLSRYRGYWRVRTAAARVCDARRATCVSATAQSMWFRR